MGEGARGRGDCWGWGVRPSPSCVYVHLSMCMPVFVTFVFLPCYPLLARQGDYYRYMAEFREGTKRDEAAAKSEQAYKEATLVG